MPVADRVSLSSGYAATGTPQQLRHAGPGRARISTLLQFVKRAATACGGSVHSTTGYEVRFMVEFRTDS
jgi:hypothetical protein